jgi:hypothetical protein
MPEQGYDIAIIFDNKGKRFIHTVSCTFPDTTLIGRDGYGLQAGNLANWLIVLLTK